MTNYLIKNFAENVVKEKIGKKEAVKILSLLDMESLRKLLYALLLEQEKNSVEVTLADEPDTKLKKSIHAKFPNANIGINSDKNIGAGIKLKHYDMIYDLTVRSKLENLIKNLEEDL